MGSKKSSSQKQTSSRTNLFDYKSQKINEGATSFKAHSGAQLIDTIDEYFINSAMGENPPQFDVKLQSVSDFEDGVDIVQGGAITAVAAGGAYAAGAYTTAGVLALTGAGFIFAGLGVLAYGIAGIVKDIHDLINSKEAEEGTFDDFLGFANDFSDFMGKDSHNGADRLNDREAKLGELSQTETPLSHQDNSD